MKEDKFKALRRLKKKYKNCKNCDLYTVRNEIVFGKGLCKKGVILLGEAPGPEEDECGDPFIGRAGKQLDKLMKQIRLKRNDCFIMNSIMCYPGRSENGFNHPDDLQLIRCSVRLKKTISIIRPRLIVVLGGVALNALLNKTGVEKHRGMNVYYQDEDRRYRAFISYHPSGVMRNPTFKERAKKDWQAIGEILDGRRVKNKKKREKKWPTTLC